MLFIAMTMIACSSDDSSNIEDESISTSEKNNFEVVYTQKGDLDESIIIFNMIGVNDGFVASNIIDKEENKDLGDKPFLSMHEKTEGTYAYTVKDKVESVMITFSSSVDEEASKALEINIKVLKDDKEVYNQDEKIEIGKTLISKSFSVE
ncbi:hypothetical protein GGR97_001595 [Wenyingzhuangia aestuarii]|nr:hypothetical protein [Wenyingzhuangia aestuarii]